LKYNCLNSKKLLNWKKDFLFDYYSFFLGWLYGSLNGVLGYFPEEYVKPLARHEVERSPSNVKVCRLRNNLILI